jgi:serine/threonine-protein kinase
VELKKGRVIAGRFRLEHELGSGGAGVVWAATHRVTGRRVALKLIGAPAHRRGAVRRRIELEARAAASLDHPHVVDVLDVFPLDDATTVLVMERLEGQTLRERLDEAGPIELAEAARLLLPAVCAVGAAHAAGVAHRDLKPENLFVAEDKRGEETTKVLDFGIAKLIDSEEEGLTKTGMAIGTPAYMAPEQGEGDAELDHRVDIWALGAILYEALSGGRPVEGRSLREVSLRLREDGIPPLAVVAPDVPEAFADLVDGMLARDPDERVDDLRPVAEALAEHTDVRPVPFEGPGQGAPLTLPEEIEEEPVQADSAEEPVPSELDDGEDRDDGDRGDNRTLEEEGVRVGEPTTLRGTGRGVIWGAVAVAVAVGVGALFFGGAPGQGTTEETSGSPASPAEGAETSEPVVEPTEPPDEAPTEPEPTSTPVVGPPESEGAAATAPRPRPRAPRPTPLAARPKPTAEPVASATSPPPEPAAPAPPPKPPAPAPTGTQGLVEDPPF